MRFLLGYKVGYSIKNDKIIEMLKELQKVYPIDKVLLLNDNGSQFIAHKVREFIKTQPITQEFTHIATPEENAYIESLFNIFKTEVVRKHYLTEMWQARLKIEQWVEWYNMERKHGALNRNSPYQYWKHFFFDSFPKTLRSEMEKRIKRSQAIAFGLDFFEMKLKFVREMKKKSLLLN